MPGAFGTGATRHDQSRYFQAPPGLMGGQLDQTEGITVQAPVRGTDTGDHLTVERQPARREAPFVTLGPGAEIH